MTYFDFSFNPYSLLSLVSTLLVLGLFVIIARQKYQTTTLRWLEAVLVSIFLMALGELLERSSGNADMGRALRFINILGYMFVGPTVLGFCLSYVGKSSWLSQLKSYVLLFAPSFFFLYFAFTTNIYKVTEPEGMVRTYYGHWTSASGPMFIFGYIPWLNILVFIGLYQLWRFWRKQKNPIRRKQTMILFLAVLVPTLIGLITDELLPIIEHIEFVELAVLCLSITSLLFVYGMLRYRLFEVNPGQIATNVLGSMHEMVLVFNLHLELEFVNDSALTLLGQSREEMLGKTLPALTGLWWESNGQKILQQVEDGQEIVNAELVLQAKNHQELPLGLSLSAYRNNQGQPLAYVVLLSDLRNLKELLQVRVERDKLQATLSSMSDGVIGLDRDNRIVLTNTATEILFETAGRKINGLLLGEVVEFFNTRNGEIISIEELLPRQSSDQFAGRIEHDNLTAVVDGSKKIIVNIVGSFINDDRRNEMSAILILHNVSQEQELENMKIDFTTMAAHELRTPLTSIRGYVQLLEDEMEGTANKTNKETFERVLQSTNRLSYLVDRLLQVTKIEQGKLKLRKQTVVWNHVLESTVKTFVALGKKKKIAIECEPFNQLLKVDVDTTEIEQVISILIENAMDYSQNGSGIVVRMALDNAMVTTYVQDFGKGMSLDAQKRLFQPYYRVVEKFQQSEQGSGLGLYVVKSVVEAHGGTVGVDSEEGKGATFWFTLPQSK